MIFVSIMLLDGFMKVKLGRWGAAGAAGGPSISPSHRQQGRTRRLLPAVGSVCVLSVLFLFFFV